MKRLGQVLTILQELRAQGKALPVCPAIRPWSNYNCLHDLRLLWQSLANFHLNCLDRITQVNLVLAGTVGEETGRLGANYFREFLLRRGIFVDEMLVAEPTLCTPVTGHKGNVGLSFEIEGVAAHSSKPHLGKNALVAASDLIVRLYAEHQGLQTPEMVNRPLGAPTVTPTMGSGGHGPNIVPQHASGACKC